ncbi:hypothetical protein KBC04_00980 [Candidatus Babeliales bacterium]|nr:hypothetical protein [Candidatus Babeliales bacterium]MBP9843691.1 hypothetical protein [Candidatus Babeliales bacterium]
MNMPSYKVFFTFFCITFMNNISASFLFNDTFLRSLTKTMQESSLQAEAHKIANAYKERGELDRKSIHGETCLEEAVKSENLPIIQAFLAAGAQDKNNKAWDLAKNSPEIKNIFLKYKRKSN